MTLAIIALAAFLAGWMSNSARRAIQSDRAFKRIDAEVNRRRPNTDRLETHPIRKQKS